MAENGIGSSGPRVLGSSGPRVLGSSGPRVLGSSGPRVLGSSGPRVLGSSGPRVLGSSGPRVLGSSGPRVQGTLGTATYLSGSGQRLYSRIQMIGKSTRSRSVKPRRTRKYPRKCFTILNGREWDRREFIL